MARNRPDQSSAIDGGADESQVVEWATAIYGSEAPTAIAFCALDAWTEGNQDEYEFWSGVFNRLRN